MMNIMKHLTFDETRDYPYYRHNPKIAKWQWFVLIFLLPVALFGQFLFPSEFTGGIFFCFALLIPLLYFSKWDYKLLFHKPTKNELILAVLMFAGYMIYAIVIGEILTVLNLAGSETASSFPVDIVSIISLIFSMMGEELLKFIPLMFLLRLFYKFTDNTKVSMALSVAIVLTVFRLMHYYPAENTIISVLLLQGLGSMFEMYGYIKTKNLFVPYIAHLLTDAVAFIAIMLGPM